MNAVLDAIDHSLRAAVAERDRRRAAWARSPNAETTTALNTAQRELDTKLEHRFNAQ